MVNIQARVRSLLGSVAIGVVLALGQAGVAAAATQGEINASVQAALSRLYKQVPGSEKVIQEAKGTLVFAGVIKGGFIFGGEGGEGSLLIGGKTQGYYNILSASVGLQAGVEKRDIIIAFMDADALKKFQASDGWKAGADGSVALINTGAGASVDVTKLNQPIVAFMVGQSGLMAGVSLDGSKISKINPKP